MTLSWVRWPQLRARMAAAVGSKAVGSKAVGSKEGRKVRTHTVDGE